MCGYSLEELIGKKASILFAKGKNQEYIESKNEMRKNGISDAYELCLQIKSGEVKWWLISGAPRYNDEGDLVGSIGIHLDITQQKLQELELIDAREQAESSVNAKQTFLANMSHEIRTPMNAILGMTNQLGKTNLNKDQHFYLNTIHSAADNLLIIINDILDLSKIDAGKLTLENIGFEPKTVISRVMQVMVHRAEEKGLNFINSFCDARLSPILLGDPYRLNQVLLNLVSNAIKFTHKGDVDISCRVLADFPAKQTVQVTVADTGIGMDESFAKNLFDKFSQEDSSIMRKYGGTGLGMSISKELIDLMGGKINVTSKKGEGTSISIIIDFGKGTIDDMPFKEIVETDTSLLKGKKILITDDNEMNQLVAATILLNYGAEITEAFNGAEAVEKIRETSFDIVLMDIQMPVMDGFEATKIIRESISKTLPIIALTANAINGDDQKCIAAGMNDYLSKPFEEAQLLNIISKWLEKSLIKG
jgi:PAS domain S-box-containing protein